MKQTLPAETHIVGVSRASRPANYLCQQMSFAIRVQRFQEGRILYRKNYIRKYT